MEYEVITLAVEAKFVHQKIDQHGGEFAKVVLRLEPLAVGDGLQIVNDVADQAIPARFVEGIFEGVKEAAAAGVLAGHPVTDLRVTIIDGAYHHIDSDGRTFRLAARGAFREAIRKAGPEVRKR
jgi:elongation factor G